MTRPPCCGVGDAAAVAVGALLAAGPPGAQAVATSIVVAKTAMRTRAVCCVLVMNPPRAPFAFPAVNRCQSLSGRPSTPPAVYTDGDPSPFISAATPKGWVGFGARSAPRSERERDPVQSGFLPRLCRQLLHGGTCPR